MSSPGLVVVGSGPAGLSAARAYREHGGPGPVRIVTHDAHPPYNRPPLSKDFLRGEVDEDSLPLEEPSFYGEQGIELLLGRRVVDLDTAGRVLVLDDGSRLPYDACVLATGSRPTVLPVPGADHPELLLLRTRAHGVALRAAVDGRGSAVVVGSGFIGCEAAASLAQRGMAVTMVSAEDRPQLDRLGTGVADRLAGWLDELGVQRVGGRQVASFDGGHTVRLADGTSCTADVVLVAAGVAPEGGLAEQAGLTTEDGRVKVDAGMRTSDPHVLAAGDAALAHNGAAGRCIAVEHWGDAMTMGAVAGANAAGADEAWDTAPGFWSEIGDRTLKYAAWGDGHDDVRVVDHGAGAFTAWYGRDGVTVGVLTHEADDDYERGQQLVERGAAFPPGRD
jgi:NADPH-dependent 2,4-dienoyl-CoA reductase/sulfur reductase-like enzyme